MAQIEEDYLHLGELPDSSDVVKYPTKGVPANGEKMSFDFTKGVFEYVRVWYVGNKNNVKNIYFVVHGDGARDYSDSTISDRKNVETSLNKTGQGGLFVYPLATGNSWPAFQGRDKQRKNMMAIYQTFASLAKIFPKVVTLDVFSLSGGGRFNHALLRLLLEKETEPEIHIFVKNNLRSINDGEAMSYDIEGADGLRNSWINVLKKYPHIKACFVHATESTFEYMWKEHVKIGKEFGGGDFCRGCEQTLQNGKYRFWHAKTHWTTWQSQFGRVLN
jgi:hypothetical protein